MKKKNISVTIITKNEEEYIERCINSVSEIADEIIVVDSGSEDKTVEIAKNLGAKIFLHDFKNFADQKNFAMQKAKNEWIFSIDADETSNKELNEEIIQSLSAQAEIESDIFDAYSIPRRNFIFGKEIKHTRWQSELDRHVWLFKKSKSKWVGDVHEEVEVEGLIGKIKNAKIHTQDKTVSEFVAKLNKYSEIDAKIKHKNDESFGILKMILSVKYNFFVRYIYRLGFLDGYRGFILSYLMAFYHFQLWIKLWQLERN